jgi:hypothetical protein
VTQVAGTLWGVTSAVRRLGGCWGYGRGAL